MGLYQNVQEECRRNKISISALEASLKFPRGSIAKWNEHRPSVDKVKAVASHFNVTVDSLVREEDEV